jgi:PAS domain S-box-containing protein
MNQVIQTSQSPPRGRFEHPEHFFSNLQADVAANLITAAADVVLIMDEAGVIRDAAFGSEEMMGQGYQHWLGKPWGQTVTTESRSKVASMLRDIGTGKGAKWRHLNQYAQDGSELPLSYSLIRVPGASGQQAHAIAFGRDLRPQAALQQKLISAQRSMERDYWQLKHIETRYQSGRRQSDATGHDNSCRLAHADFSIADTQRAENKNPAEAGSGDRVGVPG